MGINDLAMIGRTNEFPVDNNVDVEWSLNGLSIDEKNGNGDILIIVVGSFRRTRGMRLLSPSACIGGNAQRWLALRDGQKRTLSGISNADMRSIPSALAVGRAD